MSVNYMHFCSFTWFIVLFSFRIVEHVNMKLPRKADDGTYPALEFIKSICHILSLDPSIREAVDKLKSHLLRLISVGEFSQQAIWKDNSISYVIPQLICKACNNCRDVDLGRDSFRTEDAWLCPHCNAEYNNMEIENILLDVVAKKFLSYNLQDMQCKKCLQVILFCINRQNIYIKKYYIRSYAIK